jgi:hypothetical protein
LPHRSIHLYPILEKSPNLSNDPYAVSSSAMFGALLPTTFALEEISAFKAQNKGTIIIVHRNRIIRRLLFSITIVHREGDRDIGFEM